MDFLGGKFYRQVAYSGMQNYLQQSWSFVHSTNPDMKKFFVPAEESLWEEFILDMLCVVEESMPRPEISKRMVKQVVLFLPDPNVSTLEHWTASCVVTGHLVATLQVQTDLRNGDKVQIHNYSWGDIQCQNNTNSMQALNYFTGKLPPPQTCGLN